MVSNYLLGLKISIIYVLKTYKWLLIFVLNKVQSVNPHQQQLQYGQQQPSILDYAQQKPEYQQKQLQQQKQPSTLCCGEEEEVSEYGGKKLEPPYSKQQQQEKYPKSLNIPTKLGEEEEEEFEEKRQQQPSQFEWKQQPERWQKQQQQQQWRGKGKQQENEMEPLFENEQYEQTTPKFTTPSTESFDGQQQQEPKFSEWKKISYPEQQKQLKGGRVQESKLTKKID